MIAMKKPEDFKWKGGYKKDDKPAHDDRLGNLNVDGFNSMKDDNKKILEFIGKLDVSLKEAKAERKEILKRLEKLENK